jgi:tetratricopeptide (TPR) repeat protein
MKIRLLNSLLSFFVAFTVFGQIEKKQALMKHWKVEKITQIDGSRIFDPAITASAFDLNFYTADSVRMAIDGRAFSYRYRLKDSLLTFNALQFYVKKLDNLTLVLDQAFAENESQALKLTLKPKALLDLTYSPTYYVSRKGEKVFTMATGQVEPYFIDKEQSAMDFVFEKFQFPALRKGGFVVRFVVTAQGQVKGAKIIATSNDRYNAKLLQAVYKTQGKWQPAEYLGEKVNVELTYNFNLDYAEPTNPQGVDSLQSAVSYFEAGNELFERKSYRQAEMYYKKAINYNPMHINSYYQRAACNIFLRKKEEACADYQQLIFLDQTKAKALFEKYCR